MTTVGTGTAVQSPVATNRTSIFWSEGIGDPAIMRAPKDGVSAPAAVPGAKGRVAAADDDAVYVVTGGGNAADYGILRIPLDGGRATTITTDSTVITAFTMDADRVYWAASGSEGDCFSDTCPKPAPTVMSAPKTGGAATKLADFGASYLRADGDLLYFGRQVASDEPAAKTSIGAIPKSGGEATSLVSRADGAISDFVVDATSIYWAERSLSDTAPPAVMRAPKSGGSGVLVATLSARTVAPHLALDADGVYWLDDEAHALVRAPKSGGSASVVVGDQVTAARAYVGVLTSDASGFYWSADISCGPDCVGKVVSLTASCR